jgi:hypothetical protein
MAHACDRPKEYFAPASVPKATLSRQHCGRRDEQGDAAKENVYDENRVEDRGGPQIDDR